MRSAYLTAVEACGTAGISKGHLGGWCPPVLVLKNSCEKISTVCECLKTFLFCSPTIIDK